MVRDIMKLEGGSYVDLAVVRCLCPRESEEVGPKVMFGSGYEVGISDEDFTKIEKYLCSKNKFRHLLIPLVLTSIIITGYCLYTFGLKPETREQIAQICTTTIVNEN
jgi:hypothetical protein